jgi:hypothetical protein
MDHISGKLKGFSTQVLYFLAVPCFAFFFAIVYKPFDLAGILDMERDLFAFNVTILTCIILVSLFISRLIFYLVRDKIRFNYFRYTVWCLAEIVGSALFVALFVWLMLKGQKPYFEVMKESVQDIFLILIIPYLVVTLAVVLKDKSEILHTVESNASKDSHFDPATHIRFFDSNNNQKLLLTTSSVLYIGAQENYVRIYYENDGKVSSYLLRNAMKNIEEHCLSNGLVRCHRSYFINASRISVLKKDKDGVIYAELESSSPVKVPVSKKYYESLTMML